MGTEPGDWAYPSPHPGARHCVDWTIPCRQKPHLLHAVRCYVCLLVDSGRPGRATIVPDMQPLGLLSQVKGPAHETLSFR